MNFGPGEQLEFGLNRASQVSNMNKAGSSKDPWNIAMLEGALDLVCMGVAFARKSGELMYANEYARELLSLHSLVARDLVADAEAWQYRLCGGLARVVQVLGSLREIWSSPCGKLLIQILPLRAANDAPSILGRRGGAMLMVQERGWHQLPSPAQLMVLFGLTAAEARTCLARCQFESAQKCAEALHVSVATIRSQLQSAMQKTMTSKQTELLSVLLSVPVCRPAPGAVPAPGGSPPWPRHGLADPLA